MSAAPLVPPIDEPAFLSVEVSANGRRWRRRQLEARLAEAMAQRHDIDPLVADMLAARGVALDDVPAFLAPKLKDSLPDPVVLAGMKAATERLADAVAAGECIGIFGDYDVDGTTSSALLSRYLKALGTPHMVHLPDRLTEGYGPNLPAFEAMAEKGATLIITVDCGATATDVLAGAKVQGLDVIVLDHHLMEALPPAVAVVNPNRPDCASGLTNLSAGGVTFMTMIAVNRALRERGYFAETPEPKLMSWLDLVALSLVCDVMPLKGLTRVLVRQGLGLLKDFDSAQTGNLGLRALAQEAGAKGTAQASHFGFSIGPRINAAGRIGHAKMAYDLLMTDDPARAAELAARLQDLNGARQGVEQEVLAAATQQAAQFGGRDDPAPLIVAGQGWHPGVIGIVAGRLKERFDRPAIVIGFDAEGGKGSGRSVPGVDLGALVGAAVKEGVIAGGGGHPMAAGLSITEDQVEPFRRFLAARAGAACIEARARSALTLDGVVSPRGVTRSLHDTLSAAGPFGNGNPEPRFAVEHVYLRGLRVLKDKHIAAQAEDRMGQSVRIIAFGCVGEPLGDLLDAAAREGEALHLAGRIKPDDWRGGDAAQLHVEDAAPSTQ